MSNNSMQQRFREASKNYHLNIKRSIEHRLEVARAKGDEKLIRLLQAESNYYN